MSNIINHTGEITTVKPARVLSEVAVDQPVFLHGILDGEPFTTNITAELAVFLVAVLGHQVLPHFS